jgi:hypothetical protein
MAVSLWIIASALSPRPQRLAGGGFLVPCPVPSHGKGRGDRSPSLQISDGERRLLVHCFSGCDPRDVLKELRRRGLLEDDRPPTRATIKKPTPPADDDHVRAQRAKARWLWSQRQPIKGSIAETYLREARGIKIDPLPLALAFLPPKKPGHHPAMIAAFALPTEEYPPGYFCLRDVEAVHLTLLKPDGSGKAEVERPKLIVGRSQLPIALAPPNDLLGLAITEGIEDGLTAHEATGLGVWAAGAANRMPALANEVPDYIECVTVYAHADRAGRNGARALAAALRKRDLRIDIIVEGIDINDR